MVELVRHAQALVLTLEADVTSENEEEFAQAMAALDGESSPLVLLDLRGIRVLSSSALGTITQLATRRGTAGRRLVVVGPGDRVRQVLRVTGIDRIVPVCDSIEAALVRFGPASAPGPAGGSRSG